MARIPINITSIRIIESCTNYEEIVSAITTLDNVLSGHLYYEISPVLCKTYASILNHLLYDKDRRSLDPFIYSTFHTFVENKTEIRISMEKLNDYLSQEFLELLFYRFDEPKTVPPEAYDYPYPSWEDPVMVPYVLQDDDTNLLKKELFNVFHNVSVVKIGGSQNFGDKRNGIYWAFSLQKLLDVMNNTNIKQLEILTPSVSLSWSGREYYRYREISKSINKHTQCYDIVPHPENYKITILRK